MAVNQKDCEIHSPFLCASARDILLTELLASREANDRVLYSQLNAGTLAAHEASRLVLLHS